MVETSKQVRVDNWGIFFLSRLQVFFNKTDYCDLTLQFEGNVQLKVHRLVMNACTEYFQVLEQTCEVIDDVLLMPPDLQADVILPIVNFMYTGMLEFQMSLYEKLYKTAELMNITVLLKLLDAQKQPHQLPKSVVSKVPPTYNLQGKKITPKIEKVLPATLPGRKLPVWKRKNAPTPTPVAPTSSFISELKRIPAVDPLAGYDNTPKPTRFEWPEEDLKNFNLLDSSFDTISYTSKPLLTQEEELRAGPSFDDIRYLPTTNKKPKEYNQAAVDLEDLKSYVKEQKIRSDMVEYDDDDIDNDLDGDPDYTPEPSIKRKNSQLTPVSNKKVRFNLNEKENEKTKVNVSTSGKPDVDHSKIISEVLRKYPHLVKKNKNIKLKILAKNNKTEGTTKVQMLKTTSKVKLQPVKMKIPSAPPGKEAKVPNEEGPWTCDKCSVEGEEVEFVLYYLYRKHMTDVHNEKFDSRMCKYCGHKSSKHNMLMYHQYTKHGIKPPPAYNFPKCNQCPYIALTENLMVKHKLNHTKFDLQCSECKVGFNSEVSLKQHVQITGHTGKSGRSNYDCQYCTKHYQTGANLFSHIRLTHRDEARRDGIVSIDEEDVEEFEEEEPPEKVKILSNVSLPTAETEELREPAEPQSSEALNSVASGIATSLGLVDIVVLDDTQQYILHSNDQQLVSQDSLGTNQEFILPELSQAHTFVQNSNVITSEHNVITQSMLSGSDIASTDELVMVLTDHDYNDGNNEILTNENSNIVVLYSHPVEGQSGQFIASQGNLMLNSETGMLELRNGSETMQSNTVESIEMIQREIESHTNTEATKTSTELPLQENFEVLPPQEEPQQEAQVEVQAEQTEQVQSEVQIQPEQVEEQMQVEQVEQAEQVEEQMQTEHVEESLQIEESIEEQIQSDVQVEEQMQQTQMQPEEESAPQEEEFQLDLVGEKKQIEEELEEEVTQIVDETQEKLEENVVDPVEENNTEEPMEIEEPIRRNVVEENVNLNEQQISEPIITTQQPEPEQPQPEIEAAVVQEEEAQPEPQRELEEAEEAPAVVEKAETAPPQVELSIQTEQADAPIIESSLSLPPPDTEDIPEMSPPEEAEVVEKEVMEEGEVNVEISVGEIASVEAVEAQEAEPAEIEEVKDGLQEVAEESASAVESSQDEDSQKSSIDSEERVKAAKISILDDWEDTDSQQSEHGKQNTVNKLINDWDDD